MSVMNLDPETPLESEAALTQHLAGRFLANASHELRTPLTAILGFSELLLEDTYGPLNDAQRTALGHIDESAHNLLEAVNNLLDLLHIRAGNLVLRYKMVDIAEVLQSLHSVLSPLSSRRGVGFRLQLAEALGEIETDEKIVRHIIYHLLASGLRSTPSGGEVVLSAERTSRALVIRTHDTALHLPPEAVANMMPPFPLLENSPTRGYEGWEIGLPLVHRYVELLQGSMDLESLPERGTTFTIKLPLKRPKSAG
jgi:signal transduction histidine kinase